MELTFIFSEIRKTNSYDANYCKSIAASRMWREGFLVSPFSRYTVDASTRQRDPFHFHSTLMAMIFSDWKAIASPVLCSGLIKFNKSRSLKAWSWGSTICRPCVRHGDSFAAKECAASEFNWRLARKNLGCSNITWEEGRLWPDLSV